MSWISAICARTALEEAAAERNIDLVVSTFQSHEEIGEVLANIPEDVQAVWQIPSPFWGVHADLFIRACLDRKKPLKTHAPDWAEAGAFMSYGLDTRIMGKQMSRMAHKILSGTPSSNLPVEQAEYFLTINLKTAEAMGLYIPDILLKQADRVVR